MRYVLLTAALSLFAVSAQASDPGRNVAGKLTASVKPAVRVLSVDERTALDANQVSMDLSVDPGQIICRRERVSSASRIMTRRCKTVAEFRAEDERAKNQSGMLVDDAKRRMATRTRGNERRVRTLPITGN